MKKQRCTFSPEFKLEVASLVFEQGYSMLEANRSLDVGETAIRRQGDQLRFERDGQTSASKGLTPEQQQIQELQAHIYRLEQEKDILKNATALLMLVEFKRMR